MATIQGVYVALFGRPADPTGLAYFNSVTNNGANLSAINNLAGQPEYTARFAGQSNLQIINSIYQSLFGRDADLAGLNFFADALAKGTLNINNIAIAILDGAQGSDKTIVANKVAAAELYTKSLDTGTEVVAYTGSAAAEQARTFIKGVTTTVPTQAAVDQAVAAMVTNSSGGGSAATFTLTPGADYADQSGAYRNGSGQPFDFKFTAANETVVASTATIGAGDSIIDASTADKDRLNVTVTGATNLGTVTNIEAINLDVAGAAAGAAIALNGVSGAQTLTLTGAAGGAITFTDATPNINGTGITTIDASGMNSAVNGVTANFAGNGTANLTFKGSLAGDTFTGDLGADKIDGGAGDDTLNGGAGNDTIDGGAGNDTITGGTNDDTLNGGDGNDTIGGGLGNDVINGGAGNDTITTDGGTDTVTGGAGNDTITLTTGAGNSEKIVFEATGNGSDTIAAFTTGAVAAGGDVLDFTAFLGTKASFAGAVVATGTISAPAGYSAAVGENVIVLATDTGVDTTSNGLSLAELQGSTLRIGANAKAVLIYDTGADVNGVAGNDVQAYYVTTDVNGAFASVSLVGTMDGAVTANFTAANFA